MTSMPGTLDDRHFDFEEDEPRFGEYPDREGGQGVGYDVGDEQAVQEVDETFDEDLLAAGEMKDVPFL